MRTGPVACFENGHRGAVGEAGTTCLACPIAYGPSTQWGGRGDSHKAPLSPEVLQALLSFRNWDCRLAPHFSEP